MFNDETFGLVNMNSSVDTEEESNVQTGQYSAGQTSTGYGQNTYVDTGTYDDYSVSQNYQEEQSYDSQSQTVPFEEEQTDFRGIYMPTIQKQEEEKVETVSLLKNHEKVVLSPRMKVVISAFSVIMFALLFLIIFNYASLGGIRATANERRVTISMLQNDISALKGEYNKVGSDEALKLRAEEAGFVAINDSNSAHVELGEFYTEETVEALPSNWFNDVCEFFGNLFG